MLKIYGSKTSSNVQKVLWTCGELGIAFERTDIDGAFGGLKSPGYLALNPNGLMPTIDDDGFILWESNVCVRYLAATRGAGTLSPTDARARADAERWMDWQQTVVAAPMGVLFRALLRQPLTPTSEADLDAARKKVIDAWRILESRLAEHDYVVGNALTIGDIALGNAIHRWYKLPIE